MSETRGERERETYGHEGIPSEPDGGEVAPAEFALDDVAATLEGVANPDGVVASAPVVLRPLVLRRVVAALAPVLLLLLLLPPMILMMIPLVHISISIATKD